MKMTMAKKIARTKDESKRRAKKGKADVAKAGAGAIFDRSWYSRAGVEHAMDFCTEEQTKDFLGAVPEFEKPMVDSGIIRLNVISHILKKIPYKAPQAMKVKLPKRKIGRYKAIDYPFRYVPERFRRVVDPESRSRVDLLPRGVGIEARHATRERRGVGAEVLLVHHAVVTHHEGHHAGIPVLDRPRHRGKPADHAAMRDVVVRAAGRVRAL